MPTLREGMGARRVFAELQHTLYYVAQALVCECGGREGEYTSGGPGGEAEGPVKRVLGGVWQRGFFGRRYWARGATSTIKTRWESVEGVYGESCVVWDWGARQL